MPYSEEFISSRILWRLYWVVVNDERVEFDHFLVVLQEGDGQLTRNIRRKGCNRGEENSLPHLARIPPGAGCLLRTVRKETNSDCGQRLESSSISCNEASRLPPRRLTKGRREFRRRIIISRLLVSSFH